jgi:predicted RNase H-like HicB family nuclease
MLINYKFQVNIEQDEGWFVACCPDIDVCSQGLSEEEAKRNLVEALTEFIRFCLEKGTLERVVKERGLSIVYKIRKRG